MNGRAVIIGAGQAGAQGAQSLRQAGFKGPITLIGEEPAAPYQRPPLSKAYLQGALAADRLALKPEAFYAQNGVDLRLGVRALRIDRRAALVETDAGDRLAYDRLLIATGAPPRKLTCPGTELSGVHYLRTIADCEGLKAPLREARRIVIVGAGYIGLEVAASARKAGRAVTVLEAQARVLQRVAGPEISAFFDARHRAEGVDLRLGAMVAGFEGRGRIERAILATGEVIDCDAVLVGIGAAPAIALAAEAGLAIENGVSTDEYARTSDPDIFSAGDCASHPSRLYGRRLRLESVPNAIEQAKVAGANMAGGSLIYDAVPWFWSDQYDVKLQTAGVAAAIPAPDAFRSGASRRAGFSPSTPSTTRPPFSPPRRSSRLKRRSMRNRLPILRQTLNPSRPETPSLRAACPRSPILNTTAPNTSSRRKPAFR